MNPSRRPDRPAHQTRDQVIAVLGGGPHTVDDLADLLDITPGAVRMQLAALQRDGLVEITGRRPTARRPAALYGLTADADRSLSRAYLPFLKTLLLELSTRIPEPQFTRLLRRVGRHLAAEHGDGGDRRQRVEAAARALRDLGGSVRVEERDGKIRLQSNGCPLGEVVRDHPRACLAVEALVSTIAGEPVKESCDRTGRPRCCFVVG